MAVNYRDNNCQHSSSDNAPAIQNNSAPASQANSAPASQAHSSHTARSSTRARRSRTQTKWPEHNITATGLDDHGWPTPDIVRDSFVLVCGLIAQERLSINKKLEDLTLDEKKELFTGLEQKLEYPAKLSTSDHKKASKAAMKEIQGPQRFKAHLRVDFVARRASL